MTCWQTVVLPDDSGPKISVIRPRGMPPTPSARSSAIEPVGIESTSCRSREPSFMIAPRPNCFSIARSAASTALPRSAPACSAARSVAPLVGHRHPSVTLLIARCDRGRTNGPDGVRRRSGLVLVSSSTTGFSLRGLRISSTFWGGSDSGDRLGWALLAFGFFLASLPGRSREPIVCASASLTRLSSRPFTRTARRLHPPLIRPARDTQSGTSSGEGPGPDRGSDPGHEV